MQACLSIKLSESEFNDLIVKSKDWNILHGSCMRSKDDYNEDQAQVCPFLLFPTPFPKKEFQKAKDIQVTINELMHKVAYDHEFLTETLKNTIEVDLFTKKLFDIYETVYTEGFTQDISLGLIRSDYMVHCAERNKIKQVEVNMISSSFAGLSEINSDYQRYILKELRLKEKLLGIPDNRSQTGFAVGLVEAWELYDKEEAVILFIVEDIVYNIFDQRAIEFKMREVNPDVKIIRRTLTELTTKARLGPEKELFVDDLEVAVAYYRTAYQVEAYLTEKEWDVRLLIERSQAIKCPSIQYHLAGTKKVQQQLAVPGVLEKFIKDHHKVNRVKDVFAGLYSLDLNEIGDKVIAKAMNDTKKYVLKPQREGGGNNIYGDEIKEKLEKIKDTKERNAWILMDKINPPVHKNYLVRPGMKDIKMQEFISELGIYGVIIANTRVILRNVEVGHILRTKPSSANEGGIVCGAGALDNPFTLDEKSSIQNLPLNS